VTFFSTFTITLLNECVMLQHNWWQCSVAMVRQCSACLASSGLV